MLSKPLSSKACKPVATSQNMVVPEHVLNILVGLSKTFLMSPLSIITYYFEGYRLFPVLRPLHFQFCDEAVLVSFILLGITISAAVCQTCNVTAQWIKPLRNAISLGSSRKARSLRLSKPILSKLPVGILDIAANSLWQVLVLKKGCSFQMTIQQPSLEELM